MEAIFTRRSVRKYSEDPVPDELVIKILRAAMAAPSAGNQQPWQFVVVRRRDLLEEMAQVSPYAGMTREAALAIVVCGDLAREERKGFWVQDCAAATQNLLLAAHALGLGAVWCGLYPREERVEKTRAVLGIPGQVVPFALVPIGYPAETPEPVDRYDSSRVHIDCWEEKV
ncbi:MAG: nitroreductase family protein [Thermoleophilia bacterium]|nr:nitroreductase family protein [Thermoleophilia bacterium]